MIWITFVSDYDAIQGMDRLLIGIFSMILIIGAWITGIIILSNMKKTDIKSSKNYLLGIALFAILFGFGRLVLYYHDYFAVDALDVLLWKIGNILMIGGLSCLAFIVEKYIYPKTKYLITYIGIGSLVAIAVLEKTIGTIFAYIGTIGLILLPFIIYIYIYKISTGDLRSQALLILLGMIFSFTAQLGGSLLYNLGYMTRTVSQIFALTLSLFGLIFMSIGFMRGSKQAE